METYLIFKDLAIVIFAAEVFGLLARKLKAPQVVGQIIAGLLIGPSILGLVNLNDNNSAIAYLAEIGVMLIMFSAGLETNLKELLNTGLLSLIIACVGVFIPLLGGFLLFSFFYYGAIPSAGSKEFFEAMFIGTIMTATSVGISVQVLKELGKLKSKVGQIILSSAIIDDVIGIVVLTFVMSLSGAGGGDETKGIGRVCIDVVLFFVFTIVLGIIIYNIFKLLNRKYSHHRRLPILGLAFAMFMAYCAEKFFGIADITGAYAAGIILCSLKDSDYVAEKMDINSYMIFGPIFFVSIGLKTQFDNMTSDILIFSLLFVVVALATKVVGCGTIAKLAKFNFRDSLKIGVGMMTRGEVALIVASKGLAIGLVDQKYFAAVILLIICSSIATPIILKLLFKGDKDDGSDGEKTEQLPENAAPAPAQS
ncbi:MAG: cation:proton antiporter [Oscillospiraceae bacterium]